MRRSRPEPGASEYDGPDVVADAVGVLDALGVDRAHVVGVSMGGGMGQELALFEITDDLPQFEEHATS